MPNVYEHEGLTPLFAFDYISLNESSFCFNNPAISAADWMAFMKKCKGISGLKYSDMLDKSYEDEHRFHQVKFKQLRPYGLDKYIEDLCRNSAKTSKFSIPDIYQFGLYTDKENNRAPRIVGFIGKWAVFYLLWFDVGHLLYPDKPQLDTLSS